MKPKVTFCAIGTFDAIGTLGYFGILFNKFRKVSTQKNDTSGGYLAKWGQDDLVCCRLESLILDLEKLPWRQHHSYKKSYKKANAYLKHTFCVASYFCVVSFLNVSLQTFCVISYF